MVATARVNEFEDPRIVADARASVREAVIALGRPDLADDAALVASELVTNAVLHGGGCEAVTVEPTDDGVRIVVADHRPVPPVLGWASADSMTGRGVRLVAGLATRWGAEPQDGGKVIWADLTGGSEGFAGVSEHDLLELWDDQEAAEGQQRHRVVLGEVPTDLLIAAKSHVDNLVREFTLASSGARAGLTAEVVPHLEALIETVTTRFADARDAIKRQALAAAEEGSPRTRLELFLDVEAADAGEEYLQALDAVDAYCRAARLLTLETPPQHRVFRRWYVEEIVAQVRAQAAGGPARAAQPFEERLLDEIDRVAAAHRAADRAARLYAVAGALAVAATPEAVAAAVLDQGVTALGASGGGILMATDADRLIVPGTVGYTDEVVARLRDERRDAELPAAVALRTRESVWIESRAERDERFPELVSLEPGTVSVCAVPLEVQGRCLGALRFSFNEPRLFDEDLRRFVQALAAQAAQAMHRAELQQARLEASVRLQRSLLPPSLPDIPGVDVEAAYHPLGDGMEVGGDFYDLWRVGPETFALAVGDVAGTGPEAAALTALARHTLRALTLRDFEVGSTMRLLNDALLSGNSDPATNERFCTAVFGRIDAGPTGDGVGVVLGSGGHPTPLLRRAGGAVETVRLTGSLLGVLPSVDVAVAEVVLTAGDCLVLYTDGVIEARDRSGRMFGTEGLGEVVATCDGGASDTVAAIEQAVLAHVGGELADDMAILVLSVRS